MQEVKVQAMKPPRHIEDALNSAHMKMNLMKRLHMEITSAENKESGRSFEASEQLPPKGKPKYIRNNTAQNKKDAALLKEHSSEEVIPPLSEPNGTPTQFMSNYFNISQQQSSEKKTNNSRIMWTADNAEAVDEYQNKQWPKRKHKRAVSTSTGKRIIMTTMIQPERGQASEEQSTEPTLFSGRDSALNYSSQLKRLEQSEGKKEANGAYSY